MLRTIKEKIYKFILGTVLSTGDPTLFAPSVDIWETHFGCLGGTRFGKSRFAEQLCREITVNKLNGLKMGLAFIDPNSDAVDDYFAYLAYHQQELGLLQGQIYYFKPDDALMSFDPFFYPADPNDPVAQSDYMYHSWLHAKIRDMVTVICVKQGDSPEEAAKMVRMNRWMYNALYAVGVHQADGSHLSINDAIPLLTPSDPRHNALFAKVEKHLSDEVLSDFIKLRKTKDPRKQEDWVESSINRLREINSPKMRLMFGGHTESVNPRQIIETGSIFLASLGKTPTFHEDDSQVMGGLLLLEFFYAAKTIPRDERQPFFTLIDEAQHYINPHMVTMMKEGAKYKFSLGLLIQQLDNLQRGQLDLVPTVLGMCGVRLSFRQKFYDHAEILAKTLCYPEFDFTELVQEIERHDGYDWLTVVSQNFTKNMSQSRSSTKGTSSSASTGKTQGTSVTESLTESEGVSTSNSKTIGRGRSLMNGRTFTFSEGLTQSQSEADGTSSGLSDTTSTSSGSSLTHSANEGSSKQSIPGQVHDNETSSKALTDGRSTSDQTSTGRSLTSGQSHTVTTGLSREHTRGRSLSQQEGESDNVSHGLTQGTNKGIARGLSKGQNQSTTKTQSKGSMQSVSLGVTEGTGEGVTFSPTPLPRIVREEQRTGRLELSTQDQIGIQTQRLMTLPKQHCLVALDDDQTTFTVRVADVFDPFEVQGSSQRYREGCINAFKQKVFARHACFFVPNVNTPIHQSPSSQGPGLT